MNEKMKQFFDQVNKETDEWIEKQKSRISEHIALRLTSILDEKIAAKAIPMLNPVIDNAALKALEEYKNRLKPPQLTPTMKRKIQKTYDEEAYKALLKLSEKRAIEQAGIMWKKWSEEYEE